MSLVDKPTAEALALRVAELSSVLKQQRDELEEQKTLLEHNRKIVRDHEEVIRMQEGQLIERDAQIQSQNAEIRALRRQHTMDAEALRALGVRLADASTLLRVLSEWRGEYPHRQGWRKSLCPCRSLTRGGDATLRCP